MAQLPKPAVVVIILVCVISAIDCRSVAVLADNVSISYNVHTQINIHPDLKLSRFVNICCGISLAFMLLTLFTYLFLGLFRDTHAIIRLNFVLTLLLLQLVFMFGVTRTGSRGTCAVTTLALHWSGLTAFMWMLLEGLHIYSQVATDRGLETFRKYQYISFGYVPPLIVVGVSAAINFKDYVTPYRRGCWLSARNDVYWCFVVPMLIILLVNLTLVALVLRMLINPYYIDATWRKRAADIKLTGRGLVVLGPVMQLCWCFSLLAVNEDSNIFQYTFAVLNVGQATILFTYQCLLDRKVRRAGYDLCMRHSLGGMSNNEGQQTGNVKKPSRSILRTKPAPCSIEKNETAQKSDPDLLEQGQLRPQVQEYSNDAFVADDETSPESRAVFCPEHGPTVTPS